VKLFSRRPPKVDPAELDKQTAEVLEKLDREGPHMNALAAYLERRKNQNGFGDDFEYTLRPKEA
jgi:hypothetical protein